MAIAVAGTGAALGIGSLVLQRWVASMRGAAIALVAIWFVVVLVAVLVVFRRSPQARAAALGTALALVATLAVGYWTGFRETEANEDVAVAAEEATGAERDAGLTGQEDESAPPPAEAMSLDVLLSASSENIDDAVNLGGLKGSKGNQQYDIPADTNLMDFPNVVLWCNPFTVRIAVAELEV